MENQGRFRFARPFSKTRRDVFAFLGGAVAVSATGIPGTEMGQAAAQGVPRDCSPIGALGRTPAAFTPDPSLPVRIRKSAFELSRTEVDRLKDAYAALRALTRDHPEDPRGWLRQSYVHCWYCSNDSREIHGTWLFFPWHRAYLYFHERILGKLVGDDTLALPFWDWDSQGRGKLPSIYGDPSDRANPLFDMLRSARPSDVISSRAVSARIMTDTMRAATTNLFMGSQTNDMGAMENAPHGPIHIWTADTTMLRPPQRDMGVLVTAASDPVFFAHHGNIDRLWTVWLGLSTSHRNPTSPTWRVHTWEFYDENSVWTRIAISDVIDTVNSLRYEYQSPSANRIWTFTPRTGPAAALGPLEEPPLVVANEPEGIPIGTSPVTQSVALTPESASAFDALLPTSPPQYALHIEGLRVPSDRQALFQVYINLPDATAQTGMEVPNYAGAVTVVAKANSGHLHEHSNVNAVFDVTDTLEAVAKGAAGGRLAVTIVPMVGPEADSPAGGTPITYKRIYIERIQ